QKQNDEHQAQIIENFHDAVRSCNVAAVTRIVSSGIVSPDVTDDIGTTPLILAIHTGNANMVRCLLQLGAQVNALAAYGDDGDAATRHGRLYMRSQSERPYPLRTALQVAAFEGNMVLVKLLMTEFGADDSIIAPDGQHALRLAAEKGHREIVAYLPSRRGGEFRRWKTTHAIALRKIRKAGKNLGQFLQVLLWEIPRFFVWTCPKHIIVLPVVRTCRFCWRHKGKFPTWCKRQVQKIPERARFLLEVCKDVGRGTIKAVRRIPEFTRDTARSAWRFLKRIPPAARIAAVWLLNSLRAAGAGLVRIAAKLLSLIHTALLSLATFFRNVTARDVLDGLAALLRAVFVELPRTLY
ncbi:ankyrin repeat-containing domain protein, partial [Microdochium bolleyi]